MVAPTELDSYWLSQSTVFAHRVQAELVKIAEAIENEGITGLSGNMPTEVHQARMNFIKTITNPSQAAAWLPKFVEAAAADTTLITAATALASITTVALADTAAAEGGPITDAMVSTALSAAFDTFVPGI